MNIFVVPQRGLLELLSIRHQPHQISELHAWLHLVHKFLDRRMFEVVAAGNEAKFSGHHIDLSVFCLVHFDAFGFMQVDKDSTDKIVEELLDGFIIAIVDVVVVGISEDATEHEAPGDPLNAVLSVVYVSSTNLSIYVVMQLLQET